MQVLCRVIKGKKNYQTMFNILSVSLSREKPIEVNLSADHFYLIESTWQQNKGRYHFSVGVKFPTANHTLPVIISKEFLAKYTPPGTNGNITVKIIVLGSSKRSSTMSA